MARKLKDITEVSKETLSKYIVKASSSSETHKAKMVAALGRSNSARGYEPEVKTALQKTGIDHARNFQNRKRGIQRATNKLSEEILLEYGTLQRVGTYTARDGKTTLTMHRSPNDPKHHMLIRDGQVVHTHYGSAQAYHDNLTKDGFKGALHEGYIDDLKLAIHNHGGRDLGYQAAARRAEQRLRDGKYNKDKKPSKEIKEESGIKYSEDMAKHFDHIGTYFHPASKLAQRLYRQKKDPERHLLVDNEGGIITGYHAQTEEVHKQLVGFQGLNGVLKEEVLNEISDDTIGRYKLSASRDIIKRAFSKDAERQGKIKQRHRGIAMAKKRVPTTSPLNRPDEESCDSCEGAGHVHGRKCHDCGGRGSHFVEEVINIVLEAARVRKGRPRKPRHEDGKPVNDPMANL